MTIKYYLKCVDSTDTQRIIEKFVDIAESPSPGSANNAQIGFASPLSITGDVFTTPLAIAYAIKNEGTWTKITGLSASITNNVTYTSDTATVPSDGLYNVSISIILNKTASNERFIGFSIPVNATDADKTGVNDLSLFCAGSGIDGSEPRSFAGSAIMDLSASDTLKLFINQLHVSGSTEQDMEIGNLCWSIFKL